MKTLRILLGLTCFGLICVGVYQIWCYERLIEEAAQMRARIEEYKPKPPVLTDMANIVAAADTINEGADYDNNSSLAEIIKLNGDVVGWLMIDGTNIDYPFVQTKDNDYYLKRDIYKNRSQVGTLFLDYRCSAGFEDFSGVIYGHNMRNGTMFSDIKRYAEERYLNANSTGWMFVPDAVYSLEIFAYMVIANDDGYIYSFGSVSGDAKSEILSYIKANSQVYRALPDTPDQILVLSTCEVTRGTTRSVIIANVKRVEGL